MIDPTKPIRRKGTTEQVTVEVDVYPVRIKDGRGFTSVTADFFERHYENIPEPRKPREWEGFLTPDGGLRTNGDKPMGWEMVRVIEWPFGAELPEWPT